MSKKNKVILALVAVAAVLFCVLQFVILPPKLAAQDASHQNHAITHDIAPSLAYGSPYVGDNSNTVALFQSLPLGQRKQTYEIDSDACTVTIRYEDNVESETRLAVMQEDMVYTAVAAMAAIDNLNGVTYQFPDAAYTLTRKQVAGVFGQNLASLLEETTWENTVAAPLRKDGFAQQFFQQ